MTKAVIFDFFGVICSDDYWRFVKADRQGDSEYRTYSTDVNLGKIDWRGFIAKVAASTNTSIEQVNRMYENERIDPRVVALIDELRKKYKIALLTNAHHDFIDKVLEERHLSTLFDAVIVSSREGAVKPDPAIFRTALNKLGVEPAEAVYVDDLERHVLAARDVGMEAIWYTDFDRFVLDLEQILK